jgi:hypothetical protein
VAYGLALRHNHESPSRTFSYHERRRPLVSMIVEGVEEK